MAPHVSFHVTRRSLSTSSWSLLSSFSRTWDITLPRAREREKTCLSFTDVHNMRSLADHVNDVSVYWSRKGRPSKKTNLRQFLLQVLGEALYSVYLSESHRQQSWVPHRGQCRGGWETVLDIDTRSRSHLPPWEWFWMHVWCSCGHDRERITPELG